jgi:hypothetical protein
MARALPLGDLTQAIAPNATAGTSDDTQADASTALSGTVAVYDPAMCCPTGVCGPGVDPALLQIARDLRWLQANGVTVQRVGLSQEPAVFVNTPRVAGLLQAFGDKALPATLVNGEVFVHGRYPTRDELVATLGRPAPAPTAAPSPAAGPDSSACCPPGSGCC